MTNCRINGTVPDSLLGQLAHGLCDGSVAAKILAQGAESEAGSLFLPDVPRPALRPGKALVLWQDCCCLPRSQQQGGAPTRPSRSNSVGQSVPGYESILWAHSLEVKYEPRMTSKLRCGKDRRSPAPLLVNDRLRFRSSLSFNTSETSFL